jgi:hypothetical protein
MIRIINYVALNQSTVISFSISNIKNLDQSGLNTVYVAIMLFYHNALSSAYLYAPMSKLISITSPLAVFPISFSLNYIGNNIVLLPSNLNIAFTTPCNIDSQSSNYILLTFPPKVIDPYNPTNYSSSDSNFKI